MIPIAEPDLRENELTYVTEAITSGWISSAGAHVAKFEEGFAGHCGAAHGVATSNGTAAFDLDLAADGIGPGDLRDDVRGVAAVL